MYIKLKSFQILSLSFSSLITDGLLCIYFTEIAGIIQLEFIIQIFKWPLPNTFHNS